MATIDSLHLSGRAVLAPMAGTADSAFRVMARREGAALVFTELASAEGLVRNHPKTYRLIRFLPEERPIGVQIFGKNPQIMADAARAAQVLQPDLIDLNFGCPSKKVIQNGAGGAVLKDLALLKEIAGRVVSSVSIPISAKIRSGWDDRSPIAVEAAEILENAGVCVVTVHPRTVKMGFSGKADWRIIREVKHAVSIPVIGNGDVTTLGDAIRMMDETGCDLVMVGRGAMGRPWIFRQINTYLDKNETMGEPSQSERIQLCLGHYRLALDILGKERGVREMRKHIGWYLKGMEGSAQVRKEVFTMTKPEEVEKRLLHFAKK